MSSANNLSAMIRTLRYEARGIMSVELVPTEGGSFPPFEPGAHIDLHLSSGLVRSYSLVNSPGERDRYVLGILADPKSRGGSRFIHDNFRVGMTVQIAPPRNNFALVEDAPHTVLIAGGIGITPILCMYRRLSELGRSVEMLYCARHAAQAAFVDELHALGGKLTCHFDEAHGDRPADLAAYLAGKPAGTHAYCCGPAVMLGAFEQACEAAGIAHVHLERFAPAPDAAPPAAAASGYTVELARSGKSVRVEPGATLLDSLLAAGADVQTSCLEGICGTCETRVLEGCPDHRDSVLSAAERATNKVMMICVSGCKGERLVLDL
ncbi:PDR/VanB family oxidoreductase [Pandoraea sp.]|uniref:PDR/VanB family oxidoreductase n=1 Tax=Pandoraea sp. TaxID=1883445 RepID=UPI00120A8AC8|nr:PDR/VanB family oxidoreductase [Pandoraea sp.]TAL55086.1 MAG: oxidoreductase [Pandoraea sp.]TAM19866.1 MAG: oxidoreductase [Pandoraea sp.]